MTGSKRWQTATMAAALLLGFSEMPELRTAMNPALTQAVAAVTSTASDLRFVWSLAHPEKQSQPAAVETQCAQSRPAWMSQPVAPSRSTLPVRSASVVRSAPLMRANLQLVAWKNGRVRVERQRIRRFEADLRAQLQHALPERTWAFADAMPYPPSTALR